MDCQDWTPVVLKKNKLNENKNNHNNIKNDNLLSNDEMPEKIKKTQKKEQISMMQTRIDKGFKTQKDLANKTNGKITVNRINEIENGKGVAPNGNEKNILFKLLGIKPTTACSSFPVNICRFHHKAIPCLIRNKTQHSMNYLKK